MTEARRPSTTSDSSSPTSFLSGCWRSATASPSSFRRRCLVEYDGGTKRRRRLEVGDFVTRACDTGLLGRIREKVSELDGTRIATFVVEFNYVVDCEVMECREDDLVLFTPITMRASRWDNHIAGKGKMVRYENGNGAFVARVLNRLMAVYPSANEYIHYRVLRPNGSITILEHYRVTVLVSQELADARRKRR